MYSIQQMLPAIGEKPLLALPGIKMGCIFRAEKYRADGAITYKGHWFSNTVLNVGLDGLAGRRTVVPGGGSSSMLGYINVGTGTSEPAITDTGLNSFLAATNGTYGGLSEDSSVGDVGEGLPSWRSWQRTMAFSIGSCTGNLTELGMSNGSNSAYYNRQLFRDEYGDPTVITVQSDEGLRVTVRSVLYGPLPVGGEVAGNINIDGSTVGYTATLLGNWLSGTICPGYLGRSTGSTSLSNTYDARVSEIGGGLVTPNSRSIPSYGSGDFYRDVTLKWAPGDFVGNLGRIRTYFKNTSSPSNVGPSVFDVVLDATQAVSDTQELSVSFRRSWGRV